MAARLERPTAPPLLTTAQRLSPGSAPPPVVFDTTINQAVTYYPGTGWRTASGVDPEAPPDTGGY